MSFSQILELTMFANNIRSVAIVVGNVTVVVPLETILECPRQSRLSRMILHYCSLKDDSLEEASQIFARRNGHLFPFVLHYTYTGRLTYPTNLEMMKPFVKELCHYGIIKIKDGYCHQCLMDYFKLHGLNELLNSDNVLVQRKNDNMPFLHHTPETLIVKAEVVEGEVFSLKAWGTATTLAEIFGKPYADTDTTFYQLGLSVTVIHTDISDFLKEVTDTVCKVVKTMGFSVICFSTWSDESRSAIDGQWLFFRNVPVVVPVTDVGVRTSNSTLLMPSAPPTATSPTVKKKKKWIDNCCPCFRKKEDKKILMEYPQLPPTVALTSKTNIRK